MNLGFKPNPYAVKHKHETKWLYTLQSLLTGISDGITKSKAKALYYLCESMAYSSAKLSHDDYLEYAYQLLKSGCTFEQAISTITNYKTGYLHQ